MKADREFLARRLPDFSLVIFVLAATVGAFTGGVWASFGIGSAIIMFLSVWQIEGRVPLPEKHLAALALVTLLVCAALNFESTQPALSWNMWLRIATIFLPLCLFFNPEIKSAPHPGNCSLSCRGLPSPGLSLSVSSLPRRGRCSNSCAGRRRSCFNTTAVFRISWFWRFRSWPCLWISKRRWLLAVFVLIFFVPAGLTELRAAKLALVAGLMAAAASYLLPAVARRLKYLIPFVVLGWPFAAQKIFLYHHDWLDRMPHSWQDRMEIWDYISYRIFDRPLLGWGSGSSPALSLTEPHGALYQVTLTPAPHPHNAVLQLWVELGLPGLALGITFALFALYRSGRFSPAIAPFAAGAWMAGFCLSMIAYNFWTDSLWAAFALTALAFTMLEKHARV